MDEGTEPSGERRKRLQRERSARHRARRRGEDVPFLIRTGPRQAIPGIKTCRECGEAKQADQFYIVRCAGKPPRLHSYCKPCHAVRGKADREAAPDINRDRLRERYWKDVEATRAASRRRRQENLERHRQYDAKRRKAVRAKKLLRDYGLTVEQYEELAERQDGVCAICRKADEQGTLLAVDHCHDTGAVRGLLCLRCNSGIGLFRDDLALVQAAAHYLENPPARGST